MTIAVLIIRLRVPGSTSLKQKRRAIKSLKERLRSRFNISIAETGKHDKWQLAEITAAVVGQDKKIAESSICKIMDFVDGFKDVELLESNLEFL